MLWFDARSAIAGANQAVNTWHIIGTGSGFTISEVNALLAPFKVWYDATAAWRTNASTYVIGSRVLSADPADWVKPTFDSNHKKLTDGYWGTLPFIAPATPISSTAGTGGSQLPPQLACCVSWRTAVAGRSGRGRTYLGNFGASALTASLLVGAAVVAINNASAALISAIKAVSVASGPAYLAVWSPTRGEFREVLSASTDGVWDTMRSRAK